VIKDLVSDNSVNLNQVSGGLRRKGEILLIVGKEEGKEEWLRLDW